MEWFSKRTSIAGPQREKRKLILGWGNVGVPRCVTTAFTT